jgi:hypothetical protein
MKKCILAVAVALVLGLTSLAPACPRTLGACGAVQVQQVAVVPTVIQSQLFTTAFAVHSVYGAGFDQGFGLSGYGGFGRRLGGFGVRRAGLFGARRGLGIRRGLGVRRIGRAGRVGRGIRGARAGRGIGRVGRAGRGAGRVGGRRR